MTYDERIEELVQLSFINEADTTEVDEVGIYQDPNTGGFAILSASGCSCWDGDYDEELFNTFEELEQFLLTEDLARYTPSINGAKELIRIARAKLDVSF